MIGDPRVLAGLQQAYLAANDGSNARTYIRYSWRAATNQYGLPWHQVDAEIRAWTPTPAEPSLDERLDIYGRDITELAATANDHTLELAEMKASLEQRVAELTDELSGMAGVLESHRGKIGAIETMTAKLREQEFELRVRITNIEHPKPEQHPEPTAPDDYTPGQYKLARGCAPPINPAPDDPVCLDCGHPKSDHTPNGIVCQRNQSNPEGPHCHCHGYIDPGCKPAPDLDPVRVEAAAKAAWEHGGRMTSWDEASADIHELWIRDAGLMIRAYLKDGGA